MRLFLILILCYMSVNVSANERFTHLFSSLNSSGETNIGVVGVIVQDDLGFIWFGGKNGLIRYDGHRLKTYRRQLDDLRSLPGNYVQDIAFDHSGVMWVATSHGLAEYKTETDSFQHFTLNSAGDTIQISENINALAVDRFNNLIVGTHAGLAIIDVDRVNTLKYLHQPENVNSLSDSFIRALLVDGKNRIWIGTNSGGLNSLDISSFKFTRYLHSDESPNSISGNDIRSILEDHSGQIWVGTYGAGVNRLSVNDGVFNHYLSTDSSNLKNGGYAVYKIIEDQENKIWFATDHGGLVQYDSNSDNITHLVHTFYDDRSISSDHVRSVFEDSTGDLWVSTFPGAIDFLDRSSSIFNNFSHNPSDSKSISNSAVLSFFLDSSGDFWVGTEDGLNRFDVKSKTFDRIMADPKDKKALRYGTVLSMAEDLSGQLWVGTWSGGLHRYDKKKGIFKNYLSDEKNPHSISSQYIWSLFFDSNNILWVGTEDGLNRYNQSSDSFDSYLADPTNNTSMIDNDVRDILESASGDLWVATLGGLDKFNIRNSIFYHYQPDSSNGKAIQGMRITDLLEANNGLMWIATQDAGLNIYYPSEDSFKNLSIADGLPTNELSGLIEDDEGNIWVSSSSGIIQIEKDTFRIKYFTKEHGLVGNNFNRSATFKDELGNLYFGGTEGISIFHPSQIKLSPVDAPVHITQITTLSTEANIDNSILNSGSTSVMTIPLLDSAEVELTHDIIGFTFEFSVLSYRSSNRNSYAYMLDGFDNDWRYSGSKNEATYTNIPPGKYIFKVKAANRDGMWMSQSDAIYLRVFPARWLSWWAYCIYVFFGVFVIFYLWRTQLKKSELRREKMLNLKLINIDRIKNAILANTSHELRSPLNSIVGISESLIDGIAGELNGSAKDYINVIAKNGKKLTGLVDEILDYANLVDSEEAVISRPVDVFMLVRSALSFYQPPPGLKLINNVSRSAPMILADEERLLQVFKNLIDNALAFTSQGSITIDCVERHHGLNITVADTGKGMTDAQLKHIFNPFGSAQELDYSPSSGIGLGLAVSKHLIELHGGSIGVTSERGRGTCFTIGFPLDKHYTVKNLSAPSMKDMNNNYDIITKSTYKELSIHGVGLDEELSAAVKSVGAYNILIVDDDAVNRMVLMSMLAQYDFSTLEVGSGQFAIDLLNDSKQKIDLVIMDVMMPGLTGYETCRILRETWSMFELPIIFLTANRAPFSATDGFLVQGNDFISKPVSKYELLPRILNILKTLRKNK